MPHETFRFLVLGWDIDKAKALVEGREPNFRLPVAKVAPQMIGEPTDGVANDAATVQLGMVRVDWERAASDKVSLDWPVIAVLSPFGDDRKALLMIDGYHRLARAVLDGVDELACHILTPDEEREVRDPRGVFTSWDAEMEKVGDGAR